MKQEFLPLLQQEILLVQPKLILCLGADALQAVLGKKMTLKQADNQVFHLPATFPDLSVSAEQWNAYLQSQEMDGYSQTVRREISVIGIPHPHSVLRAGDDKSLDAMNLALGFVARTLKTLFLGSLNCVNLQEDLVDPVPTHFRVVRSLEEVKALVEEIEETCEDNLVSGGRGMERESSAKRERLSSLPSSLMAGRLRSVSRVGSFHAGC
jgi:hypothetical protein